MKVCFIVPRKYHFLSQKHSDYYLPLAHQLKKGDEFLYEDKYTVLDNGAFELGRSVSTDYLASVAAWLQPDEVVIPDVLYDADKTLELSEEFFSSFSGEFKFMAVAQGKTWNEWLHCYKRFLVDPRVSTIGIPCKIPFFVFNFRFPIFQMLPEKHRTVYSRVSIVDELERRNLLTKPLHILGCIDPLEYFYLKQYPYVNRTDSKIAFWLGVQGEKLDKKKGLLSQRIWEEMPFDYSEKISWRNQRIINHNIKVYKNFAE